MRADRRVAGGAERARRARARRAARRMAASSAIRGRRGARRVVVRARLERERALPGRGDHRVQRQHRARLVAPEPRRARPRRARSRPPRPRRACAAACRRCRAAATTSRSGRAASSAARRRRLLVPTRAPGAARRASARRTARRAARRGAGAATSASPSAELARHVLGRVDGDVDLAGEQRVLDLVHPARLVLRAGAAVAAGRDRDSSRAAERSATSRAWASASALPRVPRRSGRLTPAPRSAADLRRLALVLEAARVLVAARTARARSACARARGRAARPSGAPSARAAGGWRPRARRARRARGRARTWSPSGPRSRPARARRSSRRARAQRLDRRQHLERAEPLGEALDLLLDDLLGALGLGLAHRAVARRRRPGGRRCRRASTPSSVGARRLDVARHGDVDQQQRALVARPAITASSSSAPTIACGEEVEATHDVGALELRRELVEADDARRRSAARGSRRARGGGWRRRPCGRPARRAPRRSARRSRRRRARARGGRRARRAPRARASTATDGTLVAALADRGLGAHALAGGERRAEHAVGQRPGRARRERRARRRA